MRAAMEALLGSTLLTAEGEKPTAEVLEGATAIGLYFSAHWCPPCRGFTPQLAAMYKNSLEAKGFRIIFVSSDRDEGSFEGYFAEMPWAALPFANRSKKADLSNKYKVRGIPSLVILDPDGTTITTDGRDAVSGDPQGEAYPWRPPTEEEKATVLKGMLEESDLLHKVTGKHFALYFSAHWCPPCRGFTPQLAEFYNRGLKDNLEIIFVSSDRDEAAFNAYQQEMPWLALPYDQREAARKLNKMCGVQGIPSLVVFGPDGMLVTSDGRKMVMDDQKGELLPEGWLPKPFGDIREDPSPLSEHKCLIALGGDAEQASSVESLANEHFVAAGSDIEAMDLRFFTAPEGGVTQQLRMITNIKAENKIILIDIPSGGAFHVKPPDASVKDFVADVLAGRAQRSQLQKPR